MTCDTHVMVCDNGVSFMVTDFISADYGWLRGDSCDACVTLKPGKNWDGYFSNGDVLAQLLEQ